ncbi:type II secretion system protein [Aeromonas simiae]|uniref:type II secretion system protein n=1 Tax=Aeromonas simiae TaxID=218936 RepID=UPI0006935084|nr:hypothetical protein [Aeromonas simiae]
MRLKPTRGSTLMLALFVIVIMGLLAGTLGRLLSESAERHTVEVRSQRALLAAQSILEVGLYRLYPNNSWEGKGCSELDITFTNIPGLELCRATLSCSPVSMTHDGTDIKGWRLTASGICGDSSQQGPTTVVSRTVMAESFEGV